MHFLDEPLFGPRVTRMLVVLTIALIGSLSFLWGASMSPHGRLVASNAELHEACGGALVAWDRFNAQMDSIANDRRVQNENARLVLMGLEATP